MYKSAVSLSDAIRRGETTAAAAMEQALAAVEKHRDLNSFVTVNPHAMEDARALDERIQNGEEVGPLAGVPIAVKDNILTEGLRTTCSSKALAEFIPPYSATVVKRLVAAGGLILGKTNLDEFAMGASSETSAFGFTRNPLDPTLVPGGSSSGSASAVGSGEALLALGSDTGGSIRQPASYCGVMGYHPSYGLVSRYGVASMANTLDQVGALGKTVEDMALLVQAIGGHDEKDPTSVPQPLDLRLDPPEDLRGVRIAYPDDLERYALDPVVAEDFARGVSVLEALGAEVVPIHLDTLHMALAVYNIIVCVEVSSNMSRFDGIIYGPRTANYISNAELYTRTRSEFFGEEVQRRIAMGTLYLSAESDQRLYKKAMQVREKLAREFDTLFQSFDLFLTPTTNDLPFAIGQRTEDPMAAFDSEVFTVSVNLCGLCAVSLPVRSGLGGSLQLVGKRLTDKKLLSLAACVERGLSLG